MNRFLWVVQNDQRKLKLAALCQFTLGGAPIIYYGTEAGLSQERDVRQNNWAIHEETRLPMLWGEQQDGDLLDFYRALCALRHQSSALRRGTRETLYAEGHLLAYRRADADGALVCVLNLAEQAAEVSLAIAEHTVALAIHADGRAESEGDSVRVSLPAFGGLLLKR
jgi:glycosidase